MAGTDVDDHAEIDTRNSIEKPSESGKDCVTDFNGARAEVFDFSLLGNNENDLTIDIDVSRTTITFDDNDIQVVGSTVALQRDGVSVWRPASLQKHQSIWLG